MCRATLQSPPALSSAGSKNNGLLRWLIPCIGTRESARTGRYCHLDKGNKRVNRPSVLRSLLGAALVSFAASGHAALLSCPTAFTANGTAKVHDGGAGPNFTAAGQCQYMDPPDNNTIANAATVNAAGFFSTTTWTQVGAKVDVPDGAGQSGTWAIAGANFLAFDYMIVFKDGKGTNLIGFLLNELFGSGAWDSPFENPPFFELKAGDIKDVSHYTIFQRGDEERVSEPGMLALFGLALLLMLGFARRR